MLVTLNSSLVTFMNEYRVAELSRFSTLDTLMSHVLSAVVFPVVKASSFSLKVVNVVLSPMAI